MEKNSDLFTFETGDVQFGVHHDVEYIMIIY